MQQVCEVFKKIKIRIYRFSPWVDENMRSAMLYEERQQEGRKEREKKDKVRKPQAASFQALARQ